MTKKVILGVGLIILLIVVGFYFLGGFSYIMYGGFSCAVVVPSTMTDTTLSFNIRDIGCGHIESIFSWDSPTNLKTGFDAAKTRGSYDTCIMWGGSDPYRGGEGPCECHISKVPEGWVKSNTFTIRCGGYTLPIENLKVENGVFAFTVPAIQDTDVPYSGFYEHPTCQIKVSGGIVITNIQPMECENDKFCQDKYTSCNYECIDGDCISVFDSHLPQKCPDGSSVEWQGYAVCSYKKCPSQEVCCKTVEDNFVWTAEDECWDFGREIVDDSFCIEEFCGDGICQWPETNEDCPEDCEPGEEPVNGEPKEENEICKIFADWGIEKCEIGIILIVVLIIVVFVGIAFFATRKK